MKSVFRLSNPYDDRFARAGRRGTWFPDPGPGLCPECTASSQQRVRPLIIEWEPDSDLIGDFTWPGFLDDIIVSQRVRESFEGKFRGFEFDPVLMREGPKTANRATAMKRKPRVSLPYTGPPLWDLWVMSWCHVDVPRSGIQLEKECGTCGRKFFKPPSEGQQLVIDAKTWDGSHVFKTQEFPGWILCLEDVKRDIDDKEFSNVVCPKIGVVP